MNLQIRTFFVLLLFLFTIEVPIVFAEEADPLAEDNLITNPWFRDATNVTASHDGWEITDAWGLSQKNTNPTPDSTVGTSARIGTPKASYNEEHRMSQIIEADSSQPVLLFQMWQVSRSLVELDATIFASDSPDGPWVEVWKPWHQQQSSVHWMQTPLFEKELAQGFPYYKLELMCNYSHGIAGCKFSGMYFSVTNETGQGVQAGIQTDLAESGSGDNGNSDRHNPLVQGLNLDGAMATAVSAQEIEISWPENERMDATYQIERSADGRGNWQIIETVNADEWGYLDAGLKSDSDYYYRIQVNFEGGGRARSGIFSAKTLSETDIESTGEPTAVYEESSIIEPPPTDEPSQDLVIVPTATAVSEEAPVIEPESGETAVITATPKDNNILNHYGLLLIGFGLGALFVGGIWRINRRKTN